MIDEAESSSQHQSSTGNQSVPKMATDSPSQNEGTGNIGETSTAAAETQSDFEVETLSDKVWKRLN